MKKLDQFFQFPVGIRWCSDAHLPTSGSKHSATFNSLWELDGVRTFIGRMESCREIFTFNSLWELDGVRTLV